MKKNIFEELQERGYVYQSTNEEAIKKLLNEEKVTFYLGVDPTANSLHIGHFFALMMFRRLQDAGHQGILVIGGATALVGDPSGRSDMRKMIDEDATKKNVNEIKKLASKFIKMDGENPAIILDNKKWMDNFTYIEFLREVGIHFNVNTMLNTEAYASRIEEGGLTFLEMGYMLMQAYDFVYLNKKYDCLLQIGGSDQWANIVAGSNLNRKIALKNEVKRNEIYGLTCPLLMTKEGTKMGKTANGTLWVAKDKTTVFDFYQYFYNVQDEDVVMLLKLFTNLDLDSINSLLKKDIRVAKKTMAYEITSLVHGKKQADKVMKDINALYGGKNSELDSIPMKEFFLSYLDEGKNIMDLCVDCGLLNSKSEAKRLILQGGLTINDFKVDNVNLAVDIVLVSKKDLILRKGKKQVIKIVFVEENIQ